MTCIPDSMQLPATAPEGIRLPGHDAGSSTQAAAGTATKGQPRTPHLIYGLVLLLITGLIVTAFYVNHPRPEVDPDTPTYLAAAHHILAHGQVTDAMRLPGYPLLIAGVVLLAGHGAPRRLTTPKWAIYFPQPVAYTGMYERSFGYRCPCWPCRHRAYSHCI